MLPWSLEDHLLDNILGHLKLLEEEEEANESWRLEIAEEEKPGLSSLYLHLSQIYSQIRTNLFIDFDFDFIGFIEPIDQLQEMLAELKREETTEEIEQEDETREKTSWRRGLTPRHNINRTLRYHLQQAVAQHRVLLLQLLNLGVHGITKQVKKPRGVLSLLKFNIKIQ